jgi:cell division protein FtsQ
VRQQKKPRKNYRKGTRRKRPFAVLRRLAVGFYVVAGVAGLLATSILFIFMHDVITQCEYFKAKSLRIEGMQRLSRNQIIETARINKGINVLAVNLVMVRKQLLAHPWIAAAEVRREIPAGLYIRIQEHSPMAIIDLDRKYLINENGQIFKEWADTDPADLPLVSGLEQDDIPEQGKNILAASRQSRNSRKPSQWSLPPNNPFEAVVQVLMLGRQTRSILSNRNIREIRVDREIGITIEAFEQMKTIVLGYGNYALKFNMLKNILAYGRQRHSFPDFNRIDLNNVNRIVVNPVGKIPSGDRKEV